MVEADSTAGQRAFSASRRHMSEDRSRHGQLIAITALISAVLIAVYLWGGYELGWKWTGLSGSVTLWDWLEVIALPVSVALAPLLIRHRQFLTNRHRAAIGVGLIGFVALVSLGYLIPLPWTGFTGNTLWDWLELTLLPVVVATASLWAGRDGVHRTHPYVSAAAASGFVALVLCGYLIPWTWTGFRGNTALGLDQAAVVADPGAHPALAGGAPPGLKADHRTRTRHSRLVTSAPRGARSSTAPASAIAAALTHAATGPATPWPVVPVVAAATSSSTAVPIAVPSWAVVLMIPEAVLRNATVTSVPRVVEATADRPRPNPASATQAASATEEAAVPASAPIATAITARPTATTRRVDMRRSAGAAEHGPDHDGKAERDERGGSSEWAAVPGMLEVERRQRHRRTRGGGVEERAGRAAAQSRLLQRGRRHQGVGARRSMATTATASAAETTISPAPTSRCPASLSKVVPTITAMTAAVKVARPPHRAIRSPADRGRAG